ncbi:four helix bundle protein [Aetokthonos hydrillicola Thurmond2011]|jgi:four helix bundle protein|uniref:Four helix bundle protein n=1 Tax=Aetokthonos hydrillicola Thurmond2011 TaxID=2712845 RepID=A0AAP5ME13_9CYAN|nr:four helix bundle protein [Aetokthonos hydrillicola]MBO3462747.1 four helix bundle protein [Aetokthonos hydrillicola CCALA 1050]MBW4589210.1 four helix bundle protein [Aetokthonos hydrillicola CCALA 1050]MDR9900393.1 four helix bundle protein [Aetokthonos hydrillicola Thurmond2011]
MSEIHDFKDLKIWQKGIDIAEKCYFLTKVFPKDELYGMTQQIRKSPVSIPANIAEGYGRRSTAEYIRFLNIAQGSVNELETHIILSQRVGLSKQEDIEPIIFLLREESRMIIALIKKLE